jgi:hypothetical protein
MENTLQTYETPEEVEAVVHRFESCAFAPQDFHHRDHLTVALCYLVGSTEQEAFERLRSSLFRFLDHHRLEGVYNETITLFWLKLTRHFLNRADSAGTLVELANRLIKSCGNPQLIYTHFSKELLATEEAREGWVEPDLQPLKF